MSPSPAVSSSVDHRSSVSYSTSEVLFHYSAPEFPATNSLTDYLSSAPGQSTTADPMKSSSIAPQSQSQSVSSSLDSLGVASLARQSSLSPTVPIHLTWSNLSLEVKLPQKSSKFSFRKSATNVTASSLEPVKTKQILINASGYVKPASLLAIMGPSGAGKTTLLNALAGRADGYTGSVLYNGKSISEKGVRTGVGFVEQTDLFFKELTVREHLSFQARLRLPDTMSWEEREQRVEQVILELGLAKCSNSRIGQVGMGGISGGEQRRLSVATEILTNPSLIFLDEPLSGIDSSYAYEVVRMLKDLALSGRTVVFSVHQPSSDNYSMLDQILYMAEGRTAYFGSLPGAIDYFNQRGFRCPAYSNPADYFIKILSIIPAKMAKSKVQVKMILDDWEVSENRRQIDAEVASLTSPEVVKSRPPFTAIEYQSSWLDQFRALLWRSMTSLKRDPFLFKGRFVQSIFLSILMGLIYLRLDYNQASVQNRVGAEYFIVVQTGMNAAMTTLTTFPTELAVFNREYRQGIYSTSAYFWSKTLAETPLQIIFPFLGTTIFWWLVGLADDGLKWFLTSLMITLLAQASISLGLAISLATPSPQLAMVFAPLLLLPMNLFAGLMINLGSIPNYFNWLSYLSVFRWALQGSSLILWEDINLKCPPTGRCNFPTGESVLSAYNFDSVTAGTCAGGLVALMVGYRVLAYIFLLYRVRNLK